MSTASTQARPESLAQQGYSFIRRAIRDGRIPHRQFFSESTLAAALGVSRTPVREALLNLYRDGVVEIVPKRGYRLAELDEAAIAEVRLLRVALERVVLARLCDVITDSGIEELRKILAAKGGQRNIYCIDEAFHLRMAELAGLEQTQRILLGLRGKMYLIAAGVHVPPLRNEDVAREHLQILEALEQRDRAAALELVSEHVERSIDAFVLARRRGVA